MIHYRIQTIKRSEGRSAVACAAYRAGARLVDERCGKTHDYTRRDGVEDAWLIGWQGTREQLWQQAEKSENRKNSTVAREIVISVPTEAKDHAERRQMVERYAQQIAERYGVAVDCALHYPRRISDAELERNPDQHTVTDRRCGGRLLRHNDNWHAHLMLTTRRVEQGAFGAKTRELDVKQTSRTECEWMRQQWSLIAQATVDESARRKWDARSYSNRQMRRVPTLHRGVKVSNMVARGHHAAAFIPVRKINNEIRAANREAIEHEQLQRELERVRAGFDRAGRTILGYAKRARAVRIRAIRARIQQQAVSTARQRALARSIRSNGAGSDPQWVADKRQADTARGSIPAADRAGGAHTGGDWRGGGRSLDRPDTDALSRGDYSGLSDAELQAILDDTPAAAIPQLQPPDMLRAARIDALMGAGKLDAISDTDLEWFQEFLDAGARMKRTKNRKL